MLGLNYKLLQPVLRPDQRQTDYWVSTIIIGTVVLPVLFVLGMVGNTLSAAVFKRQGLKDRINLCLFTLALADILVLISNFCLTAEKVYRDLVGFSGFFITYFPGQCRHCCVNCVCVVVRWCDSQRSCPASNDLSKKCLSLSFPSPHPGRPDVTSHYWHR